MKFCTKCGQQILDDAVICVHCGCPVEDAQAPAAAPAATVVDAPSTGFAVLGFFFPLVGLILWLVNKSTTPLRAKSAGKGALIGAIVSVAAYILLVIVYVLIVVLALESGGYYGGYYY